MNSDQCIYFMKVAECGTYSAAAEKLGVTKQALSKYIAGLHARYGITFVKKVDSRLVLTEAGKCYLKSARRIYLLMTQMQNQIYRLKHSTTLRVGVTKRRGLETMTAVLPAFIKEHSDVKFMLDSGYSVDQIEDIRSGKLDLSFASRPSCEEPGLDRIVFCKMEILVGMNVTDPLYERLCEKEKYPVVELKDLYDDTLCVPVESMGVSHEYYYTRLGNEINRFRSLTEVTSTLAMEAYVQAGLGIGLMPYKKMENVGYVRLKDPVYMYHVLFFARGKQLNRIEKDLINIYLREHLRDKNKEPFTEIYVDHVE